jgi:hypothetical protein
MEAFSDRNQINLARTRSHHDPHLQFPAALKEKDFQIKKREKDLQGLQGFLQH